VGDHCGAIVCSAVSSPLPLRERIEGEGPCSARDLLFPSPEGRGVRGEVPRDSKILPLLQPGHYTPYSVIELGQLPTCHDGCFLAIVE
jgi:hypothetical protein